jgi:hypothetical protein
MTRKLAIPKALKNAVWEKYAGCNYTVKCCVTWCEQTLTPFTFEAGHNIPESRGGPTTLENLRPICAQCNRSMSNKYTIDEFSDKFGTKTKTTKTNVKSMNYNCFGCFKPVEMNP